MYRHLLLSKTWPNLWVITCIPKQHIGSLLCQSDHTKVQHKNGHNHFCLFYKLVDQMCSLKPTYYDYGFMLFLFFLSAFALYFKAWFIMPYSFKITEIFYILKNFLGSMMIVFILNTAFPYSLPTWFFIITWLHLPDFHCVFFPSPSSSAILLPCVRFLVLSLIKRQVLRIYTSYDY